MSTSTHSFYTAEEIRELLKKLPQLLSIIATPKSSAKSIGTRDYKVYQVEYSTYLLDLLADLSAAWMKLPARFQKILAMYYIEGWYDVEIAKKFTLHYNTVVAMKQSAIRAIIKSLTTGDDSDFENLDKMTLRPQKNRRPITRAYFWIRTDQTAHCAALQEDEDAQ